jgi:LmbE family N-acetylglucosaminyl deacetylase
MQALILCAHADDETLGSGGTIRKLVNGGWDVEVVIVSDGIVRARGVEQDNRPGAFAACDILGVSPPRFLGIADQRFDALPVSDIARAVSDLALTPDLIIAHAESDLNRDHRIVSEVARIIGRPKTKPVAILESEVPSTTFWNGKPFPANYFVDITDYVDIKIRALEQYVHEIQPYPHAWSREGLKLLAQYHGMQCGVAYAEAFHMVRGYEGRLP